MAFFYAIGQQRKASGSFLKKRTKKRLFTAGVGTGDGKTRRKKEFFCFFFCKKKKRLPTPEPPPPHRS
jgi:hypothetical protein